MVLWVVFSLGIPGNAIANHLRESLVTFWNFLEVVLMLLFFRGQVLSAHTLLNTVDVELIYEGEKYVLKVC